MADDILYNRGIERMTKFCIVNQLDAPKVEQVPLADWHFNVCAYYRPKIGIKICMPKCGYVAIGEKSHFLNWNWPGYCVDRTPYGVIAHELAHHVDWTTSTIKHAYFGDYGISIRKQTKEARLTNYCPNDAEWFAEIFRLFITNHALLHLLRPRTFAVLRARWIPVSKENWKEELGDDVPDRITEMVLSKASRR